MVTLNFETCAVTPIFAAIFTVFPWFRLDPSILCVMNERQLTRSDRLLSGIDNALRSIAAVPALAIRRNPALDTAEGSLTDAERQHAAALMRVNHAGEIAAQGLYQGHAAVAHSAEIAAHLQSAANEELDHLAWCEQRLRELDARPSRLRPVWFAGAWLIGAASGVLGDRWSLGFVEETERQVAAHLGSHLAELPAQDARSRVIVSKMREDEVRHGAEAKSAGARPLPTVVRELMRMSARVMTQTAYKV
ncbi:MAG: 2-polyprenyl-3-methyl-6-methoxy-1,4-benzoquinone monooxygenase [Woeseia sp.]